MAVLTVGVTANPGGSFYVYILNHNTGVRERFEAVVNISNEVTVDLTNYPQIEGHDYEIWVTLQSATNPEERETLTISAVEYTCFSISFIDILEDGELVTGENQTLEAA